jgi:hypothetical protein
MPQYPIRIDLEEARKATAARDMAKAQNTPAAKAILDPAKAVARGNRMQGEEAKESKLINRTGTGYGSYRNR